MLRRVLPCLALVVLAGCPGSKVHQELTVDLAADGGGQSFIVDPPKKEQKIQVVMTSEQPINVWIVLDKDIPGKSDNFDPAEMKTGVLASEKQTKSATLNATIPAKESFRVFVNGATRKTKVNVKIDSK